MGFKQHISRTWQMIEQQVNDVPFRPDNEAVGLKKFESLPCLQEFLHDYDTEKLDCMPTCAKRMPICVEVGRMPPKSHICKYFTVASE